MANVKITELTAATALAGTDVLPIVDVGADATKKVSVSDLLRNLPDGTASAPALAFADDQNTGVLSPGDNSLAFATSGTQRLVIDSSGNVGLGTTSPNSYSGYTALTINNATTGAVLDLEVNGTRTGTFLATSGQVQLGTKTSAVLRFDTNDTERMRIDSSGNVGIGTATASYLVDARTASGNAQIHLRSGGDLAQLLLVSNDTSGTSQINFGDNDANNVGLISYAHSNNSLKFTVNASERLRIDSSGNVNIGSSTYSGINERLCVTGQGIVTQSAATTNRALFGTFGGNDLIVGTFDSNNVLLRTGNTERMRIDSSGRIFFNETSSDLGHKYILSGNESADVAAFQYNSNSGTYLAISTGAPNGNVEIKADARSGSYPPLTFKTGGSERMRIDNSGLLGVGVSSPIAQVQINSDKNAETNKHNGGNYHLLLKNNGDDTGEAIGLAFSITTNATAVGAAILHERDGGGSQGSLQFLVNGGSDTITERMRIGNSGLSDIYGSSSTLRLRTGLTGTSGQLLGGFNGATSISTGTQSLAIFANGNIQNTNNSYGSLSDAKLKENVVDANSQWDDIKGIRVRNYNFIEGETHTQLGVVAQEVETVSPGLVTDSPDLDEEGNDLGTVTKSVNYSVLYMKAVKALQEAMDRIETLEAKVAALEAQ